MELLELDEFGQVKEKTTAFESVILSWQELADEFGTFDWAALYQDMCVFPRVAMRVLGWEKSAVSAK